jgi:predicted DCC family thiol-disulfide oxidoreductase YuxK
MKTDLAPNLLPRPAERPGAAVVIYDGQCRICTAQIECVARWDTRRRLAFLSLHDPEVYERFPDLVHEELMQRMVVVDAQGRRHVGAAAVRVIARAVPRLWILTPFMYLPGTLPLWQWGYDQVAKRRYWFNRHACDGGTCHLHGH